MLFKRVLFAAFVMLAGAADLYAYGAAHVGYTHVGPSGVYHSSATVAAGPHGVYGSESRSGYSGGAAYHQGGAEYHSGYSVGGEYKAGSYGGGNAYRYTPSYYGGGGASAETYRYGYIR